MNAAERRMKIYNILQENGVVELNDLAKLFQVTTMTVRRDLQMFEKQGVITMNYGGALLNKETAYEPSFAVKSGRQTKQKSQIAMEAAALIETGDTIIIDCGTTTLQILQYVQDKRVTVITNSWPVINYAAGNSKIELILAPGIYDEVSAGALGTATIEFIRRFHADKVFMGSHGCSMECGVTVPELMDADVKRALMMAGKKKYLLADATKWDKVYATHFADINEFDCIISDDTMDIEYQNKLRANCKDLILAKNLE